MTSNKTINFRVPAHTVTERKDRPRSHLYVVNTTAVSDRATMNLLRGEHIAYLHELVQSDRLVGAGPVLSEDGTYYDGHGLIILRADSAAHALELAGADPFHVHGMRSFTITQWLLSEGVLHDLLIN